MRTIFLFAFLLLFLLGTAPAQKRPSPPPARDLMREKLIDAQQILQGLTTEDFRVIRIRAEKLSAMTDSPAIQALDAEAFQRHTQAFTRHVQELIDSAGARNLDAAADAYLALTRNCIDCHKQLRGRKLASRQN